jgi:transcriptional regulator with XRE-family HTH domain
MNPLYGFKSEYERMLAYNNILDMRKKGLTLREISEKIGISHGAVVYVLKNHPNGYSDEKLKAEKERLISVVSDDYYHNLRELTSYATDYRELVIEDSRVAKSLNVVMFSLIITAILSASVFLVAGFQFENKYTNLTMILCSVIFLLSILSIFTLTKGQNKLDRWPRSTSEILNTATAKMLI